MADNCRQGSTQQPQSPKPSSLEALCEAVFKQADQRQGQNQGSASPQLKSHNKRDAEDLGYPELHSAMEFYHSVMSDNKPKPNWLH